jgi:hypothetical protein
LKRKGSSNIVEGDKNLNKGCSMNQKILYQWTEEIAIRLMSLNSWQVANVALFSLGVIQAESSRQRQIAQKVICGERVESAARRLRRFIANERVSLEKVFEDLTGWIVDELPTNTVYLLVDETKLGDRLGVLVVGVAWEGRCIPLAWRCYIANSAADYPEEGQVKVIEKLLACVKRGMPADRKVVVMADRGIGTSPDLCRAVEALGLLYLFRVTSWSKVCTEVGEFTIAAMVSEGESWAASGKIFKKNGRIPAQARAIWSEGYDEPWALVTNDDSLTGFEYAWRNWQEQSFRDLKSHGWQWASSCTQLPGHMERLMLLLVLAYAWVLALGSYAVQLGRAKPLQRHSDGQLRRYWSLFKEGLQLFVEVIYRYGEYLELHFIPDTRLC